MPERAITLASSLITQFEGYSASPYQDSGGVWTIGYGSTYANNKAISLKTPPITQAIALQMLAGDLITLSNRVKAECFEPLNDNQEAAILSFVYNVGVGAFSGSTLLKYLNDRAWGAAAAQFNSWTHCKGITLPGLVRRWEAERVLFLTPP
jgi:lysozyme